MEDRLPPGYVLATRAAVRRDAVRYRIPLSANAEVLDDSAVIPFLPLTGLIRERLDAGGRGALALLRGRYAARHVPGDVPGTARQMDPVREQTAAQAKMEQLDLAEFLQSRLAMAPVPGAGHQAMPVAHYGHFSLLVWQQDLSAAELGARLNQWREEYRFLKNADFVAGIVPAPDASRDLLHLLSLADDALTEAHSLRRIVCFNPVLSRQNGAGYQLLIVDDNHEQVEILEMIMRQKGYHTLHAYNGEQALETIRRNRPDLLLLDVTLPHLNGFEVMHRLRDLNGGKLDLPVIMLTGSDSEESVVRGYELGARDYVIKPCDPRDLLSRIQSILVPGARCA
ncbi:MAG: response regulator transcription factor [Blastocatellia bacterium]